jgi:hypothetical protein
MASARREVLCARLKLCFEGSSERIRKGWGTRQSRWNDFSSRAKGGADKHHEADGDQEHEKRKSDPCLRTSL